MFVTVFSSIRSFPACQMIRIHHSDATVEGISTSPAGWLVEPKGMFSLIFLLNETFIENIFFL